MVQTVTIEGGFAEVDAGAWLMGRAQPAAFFGKAVRRRRKGWVVRDRGRLDLVETTGRARLACASRPFLTHIPCAAPISAVSDKVLVAPVSARRGDQTVKAVPMSAMRALVVTLFGLPPEEDAASTNEQTNGQADKQTVAMTTQAEPAGSAWVVMATASRTARVSVADGETLSVRPEAVVAWTGPRPTGFCPKLGIWDILLPRGPKDLLFTFHGPSLVWIEGSGNRQTVKPSNRQTYAGGVYGL